FEPEAAAKARRDANRAASITAYATRRTAGCDSRRFAAAGAARRPFDIPGTTRASVERAVRLPRHEEFRHRRISQNDGARGFQPGNQRRVRRSDMTAANPRAGFAQKAGDIDRAFDGDRNAMQRSQWPAAPARLVG